MNTYEEKFAYHIRRLRRNVGMTQKQFADRLGCSEKTVSKWECADAIPAIDVLYAITTVFQVGIDELFRDDRVYFLGIDGGGTKTTFMLADEDLRVRKELRRDGCNPVDIGIERTKEILREGIYKICDGIPKANIVLFAGIAGGTSYHAKEELRQFFESFGFLTFENGSDNRNIVAAGLGACDGVTMIMGTGNCAIAQKNGIQRRLSGWGYFFDDGGSAFNVGRDALAAHFRYLDGSGEYTMFSDVVSAGYPDEQELLGMLYQEGKKRIASFAERVFQCAEKGDTVCKAIIRRNMEFAAMVIASAAREMEEIPVHVVVAGGLVENKMAITCLREALGKEERYRLEVLAEAPVKGALLLAKELWEQTKQETEK